MQNQTKAVLHLIPVPLSEADISQMSNSGIEAARQIHTFLAERAKSARQWLKSIAHPSPLSAIEVIDMQEKPANEIWDLLKSRLDKGKDVAIVSEAGMPCIADPGFEYVSKAQATGYIVKPHAGPNAMLLGLMASGFSGQHFEFHGYLPSKKEELRKAVITIQQDLKKNPKTHIFMETPYRNKQMIDILLGHLAADLSLCIAAGIGSAEESIQTKKIKTWKESKTDYLKDLPAVFLIR